GRRGRASLLPFCPRTAHGIFLDLCRPAGNETRGPNPHPVFRKKRRAMTDRSDNAGQPAVWNAPVGQDNLPSLDELLHASEAAAEHTLTEPDVAVQAELERLRNELVAANDKHLRLLAEFDNFRKRTARERADLIQFAGENTLKNMLPVLDDMERAMQV